MSAPYIDNVTLDAVEADQRRDKARPDRRRRNVIRALERMRRSEELLSDLFTALANVMSESEGVAGLHLNGDVAEWDSLTRGGKFEDWLKAYDEVRDHLLALDLIEEKPAVETAHHERLS